MTLLHAASASAGLFGRARRGACGPEPDATLSSAGGAGTGLDGCTLGIATGALGGATGIGVGALGGATGIATGAACVAGGRAAVTRGAGDDDRYDSPPPPPPDARDGAPRDTRPSSSPSRSIRSPSGT